MACKNCGRDGRRAVHKLSVVELLLLCLWTVLALFYKLFRSLFERLDRVLEERLDQHAPKNMDEVPNQTTAEEPVIDKEETTAAVMAPRFAVTTDRTAGRELQLHDRVKLRKFWKQTSNIKLGPRGVLRSPKNGSFPCASPSKYLAVKPWSVIPDL